jgi:hypothetical protein
MIPTPELRFVERQLNYNPFTGESFSRSSPVRILQQRWRKVVYNAHGVAHHTDIEEWRDVPVVNEDAK